MIRVSDIIPRIPPPGASAPPRSSSADTSPATWLDGVASGGDVCISADPGTRSRGLNVAQHAEQVLSHLCVASDDRP